MTFEELMNASDEQVTAYLKTVDKSDISNEQIEAFLYKDREFLAERSGYWFPIVGRGAIIYWWDFDEPHYVGYDDEYYFDRPGKFVSNELREYVKSYDPETECIVSIYLPRAGEFIARCERSSGSVRRSILSPEFEIHRTKVRGLPVIE